jgi:Zn finger protein HypA/HybF involved in hydrogenase expression
MSKKISPIWKIDNITLQNILDTSSSIVDVLKKLGLNGHSGNHRTLNKKLKQENFSLEKLNSNRKAKLRFPKKNIEFSEIFIENSKMNRSNIRRYIIKYNLISYKCNKCKNDGSWLNENLSLQLDHINGVNDDHRLSNLTFLCPNCHSQTKTFSGKKNKKSPKKCIDCNNKIILRKSIRCNKCNAIFKGNKSRKFNINKEKLENLLLHKNMSQIAKEYNVSSTTVKKYCQKFNLKTRM